MDRHYRIPLFESMQRTFRTPLEPLDSILVVFQNYMSYKRNNQQIQWLMRVGAGCALDKSLVWRTCRCQEFPQEAFATRTTLDRRRQARNYNLTERGRKISG
jgi:hypothetical protein